MHTRDDGTGRVVVGMAQLNFDATGRLFQVPRRGWLASLLRGLLPWNR